MLLRRQHRPTYLRVNEEIRNRIRLSVAAYSYEYHDDEVMSDSEFDELAKKIDLSVSTGNRKLDNFFKKNFNPDTGMWIRKHPDKGGLEWLYQRYYKPDASAGLPMLVADL